VVVIRLDAVLFEFAGDAGEAATDGCASHALSGRSSQSRSGGTGSGARRRLQGVTKLIDSAWLTADSGDAVQAARARCGQKLIDQT
jgi:hypothetical protein